MNDEEDEPGLSNHGHQPLPVAVLATLGIVYGDIGTSPLYAIRECFSGPHGVDPSSENVLGVLSLIFWALMLVISLKYMVFVLRADNRGEGGILALTVLALSHSPGHLVQSRAAIAAVGLFGAALLYGDGMITPAISVLSAVEGLGVATPVFEPYIIPITLAILASLFAIQRHGTGRLGGAFGPIVLAWFTVLGVLGIVSIARHPEVLMAINPYYAYHFMLMNRLEGFFVLGAVFLVVTGGEALYADMGHFGAKTIRVGWFFVALPGLALNYFGQGALIIYAPETIANPFYALAPSWGLYPLVFLATCATIIASQAVISGAFSLTRQAINLGYLPRMTIHHTSARQIGQIYIPLVNWVLLIMTAGLVIGFGTSSDLAAAYGVAVTSTMVITTLLMAVVAMRLWGWSRMRTLFMVACFLAFDLSFFGAAMLKIEYGGWFPLVIGAVVYMLLVTWRDGRQVLQTNLGQNMPLEMFIENIMSGEHQPARVPGISVFMCSNQHVAPRALGHNIRHNKVVHEKVIVMTVIIEENSHVPASGRVSVEDLGHGFHRVVARYGFMESPNVPAALERAREQGLEVDLFRAVYFLGRESIISTKKKGMARWRENLFIAMTRQAQSATEFFEIPRNQVIELGLQVEI